MEKPKVRVCGHYNPRRLKEFESKVLNREELFCDTCYPRPPKPGSSPEEGLIIENLLMCISCFEVDCNRQTRNQCMLKHGEKKKHHVTYSLSSGAVWCYICDYELKEFLILNPKGEDEAFNQKLDKLGEYLSEVDKCFQMLKKKQQEREISRQNQIEEENSDESDEVEIIETLKHKQRTSRSNPRIVPSQTARVRPEQHGEHVLLQLVPAVHFGVAQFHHEPLRTPRRVGQGVLDERAPRTGHPGKNESAVGVPALDPEKSSVRVLQPAG